jgi:hypothetical protein
VVRHLLGLYTGEPGARAWRRRLGDWGREGAPLDRQDPRAADWISQIPEAIHRQRDHVAA